MYGATHISTLAIVFSRLLTFAQIENSPHVVFVWQKAYQEDIMHDGLRPQVFSSCLSAASFHIF